MAQHNRKDGKKLELDGLDSKVRDNLKIAIADKTLLVSLGSQLKVEKLGIVYRFFKTLEFTDFGKPIEDFVLSKVLPDGFGSDEKVRNDVIKYFSSFDDSIVCFKVEAIKNDEDENKTRFNIETGHRIEGSDKIVYIPLKLESAGTLKMFALYPFAKKVLDKGKILIVDELNARLHPLLVRTFVHLFSDKELNPNNAQLLFTSHDAWQLNNGTLRRDEIWFTEKNEKGESRLYSLADFVDDEGKPVRNDENYEKNYLLGKYGGIPQMKTFDILLESGPDGQK